MDKRLVLFLIIFTFLFSGCSAARSGNTISSGAAPQSAPQESKSNGGFAAEGSDQPVAGLPNPAGQSSSDTNRLVIRNANLTIVVDDPGKAMDVISSMAESMQGFVVVSNLIKTTTSNGKEVPEANITIRVPASRLSEAMNGIKKLVKDPAKDVRAENISGQDVTKEYTDLNSRLKNLEQAEAQLREIMGSATKTEDVLAVYQQLTQIREQIEVTKGQIQYYQESAAMSAIAVTLQAQAAVQPLEIGGWQPVGVVRNAVQALINTMQFLASAAIWVLLYVLPVGLVIFLPVYLLWILLRRGRKNRSPKMQAPPDAPQTPA